MVYDDVVKSSSMDEVEVNIRKLRYRLKRQGMLELDTWLSCLEPVLKNNNEAFSHALNRLMDSESDDLLAMMRGHCSIPEALRPWLEKK